MELGLNLMMRQELALVGPGLGEAPWLSGDPKDLEALLTDCPQKNKDGKIDYLLSGGWAVEMLTGEKREHHDLDIVNLSRVPLTWQVDEQMSENYFDIFSMKSQNLLENHSQKVDWDMGESYPEISDKEFEVYMPSNEYLFLSKVAGFLMKPRDKDHDDLKNLSKVMNERGSGPRFESLLGYIPGMHKEFDKNKQLFLDLFEEDRDGDGSSKRLAGEYLSDIVKNFKMGNNDFAKNQASRFHNTLKKVYENGLASCVSLRSEGVDSDLFEREWVGDKLSGFWIKKDGVVDLMVPETQVNLKYLDHLKFWSDIEKKNDLKLESLERIANYSRVFVGKEEKGDRFLLAKEEDSSVTILYDDLEFVSSPGPDKENKINGVIEGVTIIDKDDFNNGVRKDIYDSKGNFAFSFRSGFSSISGNTEVIHKNLVHNLDIESLDKMEKLSRKKGWGFWNRDHENSFYEELLGEKNYDDALKLRGKVEDWNRGRNEKKHYARLLKRGEYSEAGDFEREFGRDFEKSRTDFVRGMFSEIFVDQGYYSDTPEFKGDVLEKMIVAQKKLGVEIPGEMIGEMDVELMNAGKYCFADKFSKVFGLDQELQDKNRKAMFENTHNFTAKKKLSSHYGYVIDSEFIEEAIERNPNNSNAYLLADVGGLSFEHAVKAYELLLKEKRVGPADKIKKGYGLDASVDKELFCKDPFIFGGHLGTLKSLEIVVDDDVRGAALDLAEEYMFGKGHKKRGKAGVVIDKFDLDYYDVLDVAYRHFDQQVSKGHYKTLKKQCSKLVSNGILNKSDVVDYVDRKVFELKKKGKDVDAEKVDLIFSYSRHG
jgi:hypothetical protein